ncbi:MAG: AI-2E family transporter [Clostridia bacterium]|nr:AI-2E family transporter [Clostridia bacterium]
MNIFKKYSKWAAAFVFAVAVITVYKTFDNLSNITKFIGVIFSAVSPFFWAFIIAYILNLPAAKIRSWLEGVKNGKIRAHAYGISIFIVYLLAVGIVIWMIVSLVPMLYKNLLDLYNNLPSYLDNVMKYINELEIVRKLNHDRTVGEGLRSAVSGMFERVDFTQFAKYAQGVFNVTSGVVSAFIAVVASIYMLLDKERILSGIKRVISIFRSEETAEHISEYARGVNRIFTSFLYSRLICSVIMAVVCSFVLSVLRVKYAVVLGIFIGAMDMIPYFGSIISSVIVSVITIMTGGLFKALYTAVVLLVLQQLDGNLLAPKIMGNSLEIRPLWIIFAVSVGGTLFGFMGMLLSVPVLAIVRSFTVGFINEREARNAIDAEGGEENTEEA